MPRSRMALYAVIFLVGFVAISLVQFYLVTHPTPITVDRTPEEFGVSAESVTLTTGDGVELAGWHVPSEQAPDRALIILHGYPAEKADMLGLARDLHPDFSLFFLDFRYFGESGGSATTLGVHETRDVSAAVAYLEQQGYGHIGVFGYSYGGAAALMAAANDGRIDAVGSYGSFANLRQLGYNVYANLWLLKYPFVELMNLWSKLAFGAWAHGVAPADAAARITQPVFLGHTRDDPLVPFRHAQTIAASLQNTTSTPDTYFSDGTTHMGMPADIGARLRDYFNTNI